MPVDRHALLRDLQKRVRLLEDDVRLRLESPDGAEQRASLVKEHRRAVEAERTASTWIEFRDDQVTQSAVAWVLATVFTRFSEDNDLVPDAWIAGPSERTRLAAERQQAFLVKQPLLNDRDWLLAAFDHLAQYPALAALLDHEHNPLHRLSVSADAAEDLLAFWRSTDEEGLLSHDLTDSELSTRFLGDLYQDLSESARTKYALLQTPEFVEEFILDQTLDPALADRPLEGFKMIDPTCGSGHFLLGAFGRLLDRWSREAPAIDLRERVQRALDAVHGVDLNPFAVAVARFRLTIAAMKASGAQRLLEAPAYRFHLAVGDSLLHGPGKQTLLEDSDLGAFAYSAEDLQQLQTILAAGRYDAVVGNPPYITVKDKVLNQAYRERYTTCKGKYALTVPFLQRCFELAKSEPADFGAGWVGQITANSFMKREFGSRLVESHLPHLDLRLVIDSAGAFIPGHGTPTVIIVGRNQVPKSPVVRVLLGVGSEPGKPDEPAKGLVWSTIVSNVDSPGWNDDWITVTNLPRVALNAHPWSLSGGGAVSLLSSLAVCSTKLTDLVSDIGMTDLTGEDEVFTLPARDTDARWRKWAVPLVEGEGVRDFGLHISLVSVLPVNLDGSLREPDAGVERYLWNYRTPLRRRQYFGQTPEQRGLRWFDHAMFFPKRHATNLAVSFAEVATHNHFSFGKGEQLFKQSAPVIKLATGSTEDDYLALLGVLNSSVACFWLKQHCGAKGGSGIGRGIQPEAWMERYNFNSSNVSQIPLPRQPKSERGARLHSLSRQLAAASPKNYLPSGSLASPDYSEAKGRYESLRQAAIFEQEELDWEMYYRYGLIDESLNYRDLDVAGLALGERSFEISLARNLVSGDINTVWFERHESTPITEPPRRWPTSYRALVERRLELIESDPGIRLLESPEHKRRWATEPWEKQEERALRGWLLDRLEGAALWQDGAGRPQTQSIAQTADRLGSDPDFLSVLELWSGRRGGDVQIELGRLLAEEHVPFLGALRYKAPGLRKREQWERTWELQRAEDCGQRVGNIPVPPKYTTADFMKTSYWRHRGKLDVPKERFISYPGAERGADQTLVLGWAGWDHAEQAQALASMAIARAQREGWDAVRLTPLLAGLAELEPWLHQWHAETDSRMGVSPAQAMTSTLDRELARLGLTRADLIAWRPQLPTRGRRPRTTQEA